MRREGNSWFGIDQSNIDSLNKSGFIMRFIKSERQYKVLLRKDDDYHFVWFDAEQYVEDLKMNIGTFKYPSLLQLSCLSGCSENHLINIYEDSHEELLGDLIAVYGICNLFPELGEKFTYAHIVQKMSRVLNK